MRHRMSKIHVRCIGSRWVESPPNLRISRTRFSVISYAPSCEGFTIRWKSWRERLALFRPSFMRRACRLPYCLERRFSPSCGSELLCADIGLRERLARHGFSSIKLVVCTDILSILSKRLPANCRRQSWTHRCATADVDYRVDELFGGYSRRLRGRVFTGARQQGSNAHLRPLRAGRWPSLHEYSDGGCRWHCGGFYRRRVPRSVLARSSHRVS